MSLLDVTGLSQGYGEKALYENASFSLYKGEHVGVVGQNGVGKSTLLKILIGEVIADKGDVKWLPRVSVGHLDQYARVDENQTIAHYLLRTFQPLFDIEKEMNDAYEEAGRTGTDHMMNIAAELQEQLFAKDFYSIDSQIAKVATGLGIDAIGVDREIGQLSGGQRAKVILAKLLLESPEVLLLDEPTNFLDKEHIDWLSEFLTGFEGAFIVVSHDFDFLDRITNCICDIEFGTIKKYHGKYTEFLKQKEHLREDYIRQYTAQKKKIEETEDYIRRNIAGVNSANAKGRRKQLERLERIAPPEFTAKPIIHFDETPMTAQVAMEVEGVLVGYDNPLLPAISFVVKTGEKLVITGFNGIGKSTLLKTLVGILPKLGGDFTFAPQVKVGYYEQDLKWENDNDTPLQIISEKYPRLNTKQVRKYLAKCGVKNDHVSQGVGTLSGGEQSRVKLCAMLITPCNFLILDEPTNHFDDQTKEALQEALIAFGGSVILVSHEEKFYRDWADRIINIGDYLKKGDC